MYNLSTRCIITEHVADDNTMQRQRVAPTTSSHFIVKPDGIAQQPGNGVVLPKQAYISMDETRKKSTRSYVISETNEAHIINVETFRMHAPYHIPSSTFTHGIKSELD